MSKKEVFRSTPRILECYAKGYDIRRKMEDEKAYFQGIYNLRAFEVALDHAVAGFMGKTSKAEYYKMPMFSEKYQESKNKNKESKEEVAVFEMKKRTKMLEQLGLMEGPS